MNKTAKIYVAGHKGMVGSGIVRELRVQGYDNLLLRTKAELDLMDQKKVQAFFDKEKPEYVVLAAARVGGIKANMDHPAEFLYENLQIQNNVVWSAHLSGVKKLLFLGSSCIYPRKCQQPMKEEYFMDGKVEPTNEGYAVAKIAGLELCDMISREFGRNFISCMPTNIYGMNDNFDPNSSHVIPAMITKFHEAKIREAPEVSMWGTGSARREFMEVDDLARAVVFLLQKIDYTKDSIFYNLGTGEDVSILELAELIRDIVGYRGKIVWDTSKPDGMPRKLLDVSRINALGWHHTIDLKEGIKNEYEWYLKNVYGK